MGVAGILTSELFGLTTTLDVDTQKKLDRQRQLLYKPNRTKDEEVELHQLTASLDELGFTRTTRDPLYDKYLEKLFSRPEFQEKEITDKEREEMQQLTDEILDEILPKYNK